ncbi:CHAP domain-containing protein [Streptococcus suis]|uniref:CHAP domain-containing protein n=1 Tax=Streptococcus suis TaxID=1307 RepID=UPI00240FA8E9|nr:CHAP domain-containing protein [Streptococcus suis]MDG3136932.1 CHAP domain-containing protein [Streptococcus suis]
MKKHKKKLFLVGVGISLLPFLFFIMFLFLMLKVAITPSSSSQDTVAGIIYVKHWTNGDAYTHHFLHQRYGITTEQIEGFIRSQGYEPIGRATGEKFLYYQRISGIDVRVLVAIAQMESSYGTAGVAKQFPNSNMWGYGAFDSDPNNGGGWDSETALANFKAYQIEQLGNTSFQITDERAQQYALGVLPIGKGVYYTDTSGTGKARAQVMEAFDKYIDENGGTPEPPFNTLIPSLVSGGGTVASSWDFPTEYAGKLKYGQPSVASLVTQAGSGYPEGECTWYVYNRLMETGIITASDGYGYLGNGQDWVGSLTARGWQQSSTPVVGGVVSMAFGEYGHVTFIEHVNPDGTFLISECNWQGNRSQVHYRVISHESNYTYAYRK